VATGSAVQLTQFTVPTGIDTGAADLAVVANGIGSNSISVTIQA
jgi:hypothetical protein